MKELKNHVGRIWILAATILLCGPVAGNGAESSRMDQLMKTLNMSPADERVMKASLDQAIADIAAMGDPAVDPLMKAVREGKNFNFAHRATRALDGIKTPKARDALLEIALQRESEYAARCYLRGLEQKLEARRLLVSKNSDILATTLLALEGAPIDRDLFSKLEEMLLSQRLSLRMNAARVIGADPGEGLVQEKTTAIINALNAFERWPDANDPFPSDFTSVTIAEHSYAVLTTALSGIKGSDSLLREAAKTAPQKTRWAILIALGYRGDMSVKPEIYSIIKNTGAGTIRITAVDSLKIIGTTDDLPFLRELARSDPFTIPAARHGVLADPATGRPTQENPHPVRQRAQFVIRAIEKKEQGKPKSDTDK